MEISGLDFLFRLKGASSCNQNIVIVGIDDENISKVGRWPWSREWHGAITKALKEFGAKAIYFDIIFSEESTPEIDDVFAEAMDDADCVYLPFTFQERSRRIESALFPIKKFSDKIKGTGSINIYPDIDGSLRSLPLIFESNKNVVYPHVALQIAMDYTGVDIDHVEPDRLVLSDLEEEVEIPFYGKNRMLLNWIGKWKQTFQQYSFIDVLVAYKKMLAGEDPDIDIEPFKDSICLIAVTAIGLHDIKPTPLEPEYPGIGILATAISNILDRKFISFPPFWVKWMLVYLLSLIPFLFVSGERPLYGIMSVAIVYTLFFAIVFILFKKNIGVDFTLPMTSLFASYSGVAAFRFVRVSMERQHFLKLAVTDELTGLSNIRYFMMILKTECLAAKETQDKKFCIIMVDIDHFKHFNDTYGHATGDIVLKATADALIKSVRGSDVVARYGGEEMIILLRSSSLEAGLKVAEKVRKNVEENSVTDDDGESYSATISLGVASFLSVDNEKMVVKRADDGLYKAKNSGRNRVETVERMEE